MCNTWQQAKNKPEQATLKDLEDHQNNVNTAAQQCKHWLYIWMYLLIIDQLHHWLYKHRWTYHNWK